MNRHVTNDKSQVQVIAAQPPFACARGRKRGPQPWTDRPAGDLARSTVQRIVAALETERLVIAATPNRACGLGHHPAAGSPVRSDFVTLVRPFLEHLSEELHETVDLSTVRKITLSSSIR
jgi:hypothetical protein